MKLRSDKRRIAAFTIIMLTIILTGVSVFAQNSEKMNIGLIYPLSSNGRNAPRDTNKFSLNLIAGLSAAEHGMSFAGMTNVVKNNARGLQIAGFSNHIGKKADGVMLAGFINTYGTGSGLATAGFGNFAKAKSNVQIAGAFNKAGDVSSLQVTGLANVAEYVRGSQISGFLNIAKNIKGLQMAGFINIADTADCQIGLINISKNGEKAFAATIDENQTVMLTFRSGVKLFYGILGIGYNFKNKKEVYAFEAGIGIHAINAGIFRLNAELAQSSLLDFKKGEYYRSSFRLLPAVKLSNAITLFGGPSLNYINTDTEEGKSLKTKYISTWGGNEGRAFQAFYFGYTAGVQIGF